jgi:uncharacterized integral membrane protein (TIGR02327 family)
VNIDPTGGYSLSFGAEGVVSILFMMLGIAISWYALGNLRWDVFIKHPQSGSSRTLRLIFAIILGTQLANFLMQYLQSTLLLRHW